MRLVMAVSKDNFVARGERDDMRWTGATDKALFKLVTTLGGEVLAAGRKTAELLPHLEGRTVLTLSRGGYSLLDLYQEHPRATLIGGQTVALEALELNLIDEVVLMHLERLAFSGIRDKITPIVVTRSFTLTEAKVLDVMVRIFRLRPRNYAQPPFELDPR